MAPLLAALFGTPRDVALVGAVAARARRWRARCGTTTSATAVYIYRICVVAAVERPRGRSPRAGRAQVHRDRERFALLAAIAEIADGTRSLEGHRRARSTTSSCRPSRTSASSTPSATASSSASRCASAGPRGDEHRGRARRAPAARPSTTPTTPSSRASSRPSTTRCCAGWPPGPTTSRCCAALGATSFVIVPLRARGRRLGSLTLIATTHSGRRYGAEDLEFAKVLAGRAALALDNAGLFSELETIEAQLTVALSTLAEAVTVQHSEGALIYANEAAARMLGYDSPQELLGDAGAGASSSASRRRSEDGSPLRMEELPGRQVLAGRRAQAARHARDQPRDRRGGLARHEGLGRVRPRRQRQARRQRHRGHHRGQARRADPAHARARRRAAVLVAGLRGDAAAGRRARRPAARRLVRGEHARRPRLHPLGRGRARRPREGRLRAPHRRALPDAAPTPRPAPRRSCATASSQLVNEVTDEMLVAAAQDDEHLELLRSVGLARRARRADDRRRQDRRHARAS